MNIRPTHLPALPPSLRPALALALLTLWLALPTAVEASTELIRVTVADKAEWIRLAEFAPESRDCGARSLGTQVEFPIDVERRLALEAQGFDIEVMVPDLASFYATPLRGGGLFGAYHTYTEAIADMDALVAAYPALISAKFSVGQTIEGREIWVYKISDNPDVDEDEPEIFFNAYIHAREAITFEILYDLATRLLQGHGLDPYLTSLVDEREIFLMPVANPDGVEYNAQTNPGGGGLWRKNRRANQGGGFGVDLNRNFGYLWGYDNQGSSPSSSDETYRGTGPFSEPETVAMRDFVLSRHFSLIVNYHSYSNLEIFAPEYDGVLNSDYDELLAIAQAREENSGYESGPTWQVLYRVNGGANDWMYSEGPGKPRIFSILTEVGDSFWPPESQIPTLLSQNLPGNLRLIEIADNPYRALRPNVATVLDPGTVGPDFLLEWVDGNADPDNPGVTWTVIEATGHAVGADEMETPTDRWNLGGWVATSSRVHSGIRSIRSMTSDTTNDLAESTRGYLVQPGDNLTFWTWYSIENGWDYGYVEVATDARDFTAIPGTITTESNPNSQNTGRGITGSSGGWVLAVFDLSDYVGETIWVRFHGTTDANTLGEGWYVDDVSPSDLFDTETVIADGVEATELMVTGRAPGEYSYLVQAVDADGQAGAYSSAIDVTVGTSASVDPLLTQGTWNGLRVVGRNPFADRAVLAFDIPEGAPVGSVVTVRVHDVQGRAVGSPLRGTVGEGFHASTADGGLSFDRGQDRLAPGTGVAVAWAPREIESGVYFVVLEIGSERSEQRVLRLR